MLTLVSFVLMLGVIIFVHEFGHFITAKLFGMRVFIFSFGFGKRLWGFKWGDTDCRLSLVPLGGYVKLEGEPEDYISERLPAGAAAEDPSMHKVALADGEVVTVENPNYFTARPVRRARSRAPRHRRPARPPATRAAPAGARP